MQMITQARHCLKRVKNRDTSAVSSPAQVCNPAIPIMVIRLRGRMVFIFLAHDRYISAHCSDLHPNIYAKAIFTAHCLCCIKTYINILTSTARELVNAKGSVTDQSFDLCVVNHFVN